MPYFLRYNNNNLKTNKYKRIIRIYEKASASQVGMSLTFIEIENFTIQSSLFKPCARRKNRQRAANSKITRLSRPCYKSAILR